MQYIAIIIIFEIALLLAIRSYILQRKKVDVPDEVKKQLKKQRVIYHKDSLDD